MPRFALLSVSDKLGLIPLAQGLIDAGFVLLSTGGTAKALSEAGLSVRKVSEHTGAPEILGGRVKTLHPRIHGGILADRVAHAAEAEALGLDLIDVVVCNLYPFAATVSSGASSPEIVEQIDIGGPCMVRAAAKNFAGVTVLVDPEDYPLLLATLPAGPDLALRRRLAVKAFRHVAHYDATISTWLDGGEQDLPAEGALPIRRVQSLRYGENPHQRATFYADGSLVGRSLARAKQLQGKELSFNNLGDLDGALRAVFDLEGPSCVIVKHGNPCGASSAGSLAEAYDFALSGDPVSAYGGIVAFNQEVDAETVRALRQSKVFFEVLAAPGFTPEARERLAVRENLRVLELPSDWASSRPGGLDARRVQGGWLLQDWDVGQAPEWRQATRRAPTADEDRALRFAWALCRSVKSNAIVLARLEGSVLVANGVGAGQMSRVDSVHLALRKAPRPVPGSVLASDAFFPFPDGPAAFLEAGGRAVVQPGGSIRDAEVVAELERWEAAMVLTGVRHFRH